MSIESDLTQRVPSRRDLLLLTCSVTLMISLFCNLYICCNIAITRANPTDNLAEQEEITRALFVWDVRRSSAVLPATDHQLVLSTRDGKVTYEFDQTQRKLTRSFGSETDTLLSGVESVCFLFCQRPEARNGRGSAKAGLVVLKWRIQPARGPQQEHSAVACL